MLVREWKRIGEGFLFLKFNNQQSLLKLKMTFVTKSSVKNVINIDEKYFGFS